MQRIGICTAGVNAADHVHRADLAPDIDCRDVGTGAAERATDLHGFDPASGLDAQRVGRQPRDHSAYQRVTGAAFGVDSLVDDQPSDRLADLDPDRGIRVRGDLVELHRVDRRAGKVVEPVDVESTGADPVGLYRSLHVQCRDGAEVDEANTAPSGCWFQSVNAPCRAPTPSSAGRSARSRTSAAKMFRPSTTTWPPRTLPRARTCTWPVAVTAASRIVPSSSTELSL